MDEALKKDLTKFFEMWDAFWLSELGEGPTFVELNASAEKIRKQLGTPGKKKGK